MKYQIKTAMEDDMGAIELPDGAILLGCKKISVPVKITDIIEQMEIRRIVTYLLPVED